MCKIYCPPAAESFSVNLSVYNKTNENKVENKKEEKDEEEEKLEE